MLYIQVKIFLKNRTTKEQYSRSKQVVPKQQQRQRASTINSQCMFTEDEEETPVQEKAKTSDEIIYEFGAPEDFTG